MGLIGWMVSYHLLRERDRMAEATQATADADQKHPLLRIGPVANALTVQMFEVSYSLSCPGLEADTGTPVDCRNN